MKNCLSFYLNFAPISISYSSFWTRRSLAHQFVVPLMDSAICSLKCVPNPVKGTRYEWEDKDEKIRRWIHIGIILVTSQILNNQTIFGVVYFYFIIFLRRINQYEQTTTPWKKRQIYKTAFSPRNPEGKISFFLCKINLRKGESMRV